MSYRTLTFLFLLCALHPAFAEEKFTVDALQAKFAAASDLRLVNDVSDLPPDVVVMMNHIPWLQGQGLANFGDVWAIGDAPRPGLPVARHLFSGISKVLRATVFQTSAHAPRYWLLLTEKESTEYCLYELPAQNLATVQLNEIQFSLRPNKQGRPPRKIPECKHQSLVHEFQTLP